MSQTVKSSKKNFVEIPSLYKLCIKKISSHIERFPPEVFCALSEHDWETIVKQRHTSTSPSEEKTTAIAGQSHFFKTPGIDGFGRMSPAISDKTMLEIEGHNPHLAESKVTDELIWKDCVEYKFKLGPTRPKSMRCPWPMLVEKLRLAVEDLMGLLDANANEDDVDIDVEKNKFQKTIHDSVFILMDSPMSLDLLNETKIGKSVSKCLKKYI